MKNTRWLSLTILGLLVAITAVTLVGTNLTSTFNKVASKLQ